MEDRACCAENKFVSLNKEHLILIKKSFRQVSYNEVLDCLPPAPELVHRHDLEVGHVGVVVEVVHPVPD